MSNDEIRPLELSDGEEALVVRPKLEISLAVLPAGGSAFVNALQQGKTFGEAMVAAIAVAADFDLAGCLRELLLADAFVAISVAP